jgi:hypothetical protein
VEGEAAEAGVDGAGEAPDGGVDGVDAGAERAGVVPGERVEARDAQRRLRRRRVHELQPPQPRPLLQANPNSGPNQHQIEPRSKGARGEGSFRRSPACWAPPWLPNHSRIGRGLLEPGRLLETDGFFPFAAPLKRERNDSNDGGQGRAPI